MGEAKRRKDVGEYPAATTKPGRQPAQPSFLEPVSWQCVQPVERHPKGEEVLAVLGLLREDHKNAGGKPMIVVVEDSERQPVIRIQTMGLGAFLDLVRELQELGLSDRLEHHLGSERGVDAAFA